MASDRKKRYTFFTDIRRNPLSYGMLIPAALYTILFGYLTIPFMFICNSTFNNWGFITLDSNYLWLIYLQLNFYYVLHKKKKKTR